MFAGISEGSRRSLIATAIFCTTAVLTANIFTPDSIQSCGDVPCYHPSWPTWSTFASLSATAGFLGFFVRPVFFSKLSSLTGISSKPIVTLISGFAFGTSLLVSGLANPAKVQQAMSLLNLRSLDPSLYLVFPFGVLPSYIILQRASLSKSIESVNSRFVAGCIVFGVGWGLTGTCPGPAVIRAVFQPLWGVLWIGGFALGRRLPI
jgi:hypothetical protein